MPNRLAREPSPYLRQHAQNPVDWYPWGDEAFEKAKREDKPVFLSIGYATCHWCHVMAHESFEDEEVARLMNEAFVSVKVDREERPDVDNLYMTVCQMMTGHGGWPLNVLLTPEREPFHAMTYVPKSGRFGRMGMTDLVPRIHELWRTERERVLRSAESLTGALKASAAQEGTGGALGEETLRAAYDALAQRFDAAHGGFGAAPKFPSPHNLLFLLRYWRRTGKERALGMVTQTLDAMRRGGIFDHLGYGFHRYSTDARWLLPHFEKMLYDQATLAWTFVEAYQATGHPRYRATAEEIFAYVLRDLTAPEGGFYSAEDADSEGEEGTFYVWTTDEVRDVLSENLAALVIRAYGLEKEGNFVEESTRRKTGANILHLREPIAEIAADEGLSEAALEEKLSAAREALFARREKRERPLRDDKILTDWNGLLIAALAKAARAFGEARYAEAAETAAAFLLEEMADDDGRLLHRYHAEGEEKAGIRAHLDDCAFLAYGLSELYEATFDEKWLEAALALAEEMTAHFHDAERGGFFLTADDGEQLLVRQKGFYDGAIPSGNSLAMLALLRLARLTGRTGLEEQATGIAEAASAQVGQQPTGFTALLMGLDFGLGPAREIVIAGAPGAEGTQTMLRVVREAYLPSSVVLLRPDGDGEREEPLITKLAPFTAAQRAREGEATAYVCQNHQCRAPVTEISELRAALEGAE